VNVKGSGRGLIYSTCSSFVWREKPASDVLRINLESSCRKSDDSLYIAIGVFQNVIICV